MRVIGSISNSPLGLGSLLFCLWELRGIPARIEIWSLGLTMMRDKQILISSCISSLQSVSLLPLALLQLVNLLGQAAVYSPKRAFQFQRNVRNSNLDCESWKLFLLLHSVGISLINTYQRALLLLQFLVYKRFYIDFKVERPL